MPFLTHFRTLHEHGEWADRQLLDAVRSCDAPLATRELAHVRGGQEIWLSRIEQRPPILEVWPTLTVDELAEVGTVVDARWRAYLGSLTAPTLSGMVSYRNLSGKPFTMPLNQIIAHVQMHGHYHRGKANAAIVSAGGAPVTVDYIQWERLRLEPSS